LLPAGSGVQFDRAGEGSAILIRRTTRFELAGDDVGIIEVARFDELRVTVTDGTMNLNRQIIYPGRESYGLQMPASPVVS
jgi:hypothetical protein